MDSPRTTEPTFTVRLGRNGRLTIPAAIRRQLGLKAGDVLSVEAIGGKIVLEPQCKAVASSEADQAGNGSEEDAIP